MDDRRPGGPGSRRDILRLGLAVPLVAAGSTSIRAAARQSPANAREANKAVVLAYLQACDQGDVAAMNAVIAAGATWWIVGRRDYDRSTIMAINAGRYKPDGSRRSTILGIAAEADRVALEYETATVERGVTRYRVYHHLFIVRNGAIHAAREYLDPPPLAQPFTVSQAHPPGGVPWVARAVNTKTEAQTREVALAFLTGSTPLPKELRSPQFRWWVTGYGYHDLDDYLTKLQDIMRSAPGPREAPVFPTTRDMSITVEGERAAVHLVKDTIFPNYDYANRFHMVVLVRDGKVVELREHNDLGAAIRGGLPVTEAMRT